MREADVQTLIRIWCGRNGFLCFRCNAGSVVTQDGKVFRTGLPSGFSDLIILHHGTVLFCEVKSQAGRLREDQKAFREAVEAHGYEYLVARSVEDVSQAVSAYDSHRK